MTEKEKSRYIIEQINATIPNPYTVNHWYTVLLDNGLKIDAMRNQQGFTHIRKEIKLYTNYEGVREFLRMDYEYMRVNRKGIIVAV